MNRNLAKVAGALALVALPVVSFAAAGDLDYATAATDFQTKCIAALAVIGIAVLTVRAAFAAFSKSKGVIK